MSDHDGQEWLDQMWYAGYCDETIRYCSETTLNPEGSKQRLGWMREHTPTCHDCLYANFMKNQEAAIAEELGFLQEFMHGGDVTTQPGFKDKLAAVLERKIAAEVIDSDVREWVRRVAERRGKPWPGRVQ